MIKELLIFLLIRAGKCEMPHMEVTSGVRMDNVEGAVLYTSTVPIFYRVPHIERSPSAISSCERLCHWELATTNEIDKGHKDAEGEERFGTARSCAIMHDSYEILQSNRKILHTLEEQYEVHNENERFYMPQSKDERRRRIKRVALSEPLGSLLEILSGVPSASTFRQVTAHVDYIDKFSKRLYNLMESRDASFIKMGTAVSKLSNQTREGFNLINAEMKNITIMYDRLQQEYTDTDMSVLTMGLVFAEMTNIQHNLLTYMWMEKSRDLCLQKKIPALFIGRDALQRDLQELRIELENENLKMAIPDYEIDLYYKTEIADCVWERNTGLIRVQVPIVSSKSEWKLQKIQAIPYTYFNRTCYIDIPTTYVGVNGDEIIPFENHDIKTCLTSRDFLCHVPRYGNKNSRQNTCIRKMVKGDSIDELQKICPIDCHANTKPEVALQGPREYVISNAESNRAVIECPGKTVPLKGPNIGSISVLLPCDCKLLVDALRMDNDAYPCIVPHIKHAVINHTLPAIFSTKYPTVKVAVNKPILLPIGKDVSNILDPNVDIFDANTLTIKPPVEEDYVYPEIHEWMGEAIQENHHYLIYTWLVACTMTLLYILIFIPRAWRAPAVNLSMTRMIPPTEARRPFPNSCVLPIHLEILLWVYLVVTVILTTPYVVTFVSNSWSKYKREKALGSGWLNVFSNGSMGNRPNRNMEDIEADLAQPNSRNGNFDTTNTVPQNIQRPAGANSLFPRDPTLHRL